MIDARSHGPRQECPPDRRNARLKPRLGHCPLKRATLAFAAFDWRETEPRLEDVFIHQLATKEAVQ